MNASKFTCIATAGMLLTLGNAAFAGTITPSGQPSFTPAGVVSENSIQVTPLSASSLVRIFGNATITPGAGASTVTLNLTGTFTANSGDLASFFYNFNIALNSAAPATFTLSVTAQVTNPFPTSLTTSTGPQSIAANSNQSYTGMRQTPPAPFNASGNFIGSLTFNFGAGTAAGDTLFLSIPNNSIDFQIAPTAVPEPSTYALLVVGLLGLLWHRSRRAARA